MCDWRRLHVCVIGVAFMRVWLLSSWYYRWLCRPSPTVWFSSSWCNVYLYFGDSDKQSKYNQRQEIKSMVISILQNLSHRYSNPNSNVKCVDSTIKCKGFELFHNAINMDVVSSVMISSDFGYMFISMYC